MKRGYSKITVPEFPLACIIQAQIVNLQILMLGESEENLCFPQNFLNLIMSDVILDKILDTHDQVLQVHRP